MPVPLAHANVGFVSRYLASRGVNHEIVPHEPTMTATAEARASSMPADRTAKTIVLGDHGTYVLAVIPASERLDLDKVRALLGAGESLHLASKVEMSEAFPEFEVGAVPPVSSTLIAAEVVDRGLTKTERILCGGGDHRHSIYIDPEELVAITHARVADICED